MTPQRLIGTLLAILAVALVALAAFLYGSSSVGTASTDGSGELLSELRELRRTQERTAEALVRLEDVLAERLQSPTPELPAREPLDGLPSPESFEALARSLDALRETIERESSETQSLIRAAPAFGGESLSEVRTRRADTDWGALDELTENWRGDEKSADRSQYFQTARDLLEAYGPPSAIYRPKGGILFCYRRHAEGEAGSALYFRMQDGIVVEFFVEEETKEEGP